MPEGKFSLRAGSNRRHVSAHPAHRICRLVFALALLAAPSLHAEPAQGTIAEVTLDAELFKQPRDGGPSHGVLPKGTLLRLTGDQDGPFYAVEVELEQGNIEGWVRQDRLNLDQQAREQQEQAAKKKSAPATAATPSDTAPRKKNRLRVPKDEHLLLTRQNSFFFGVHGGGSWTMVGAITNTSFNGMGFSAGAHVGTFLRQEMPLRLEVTYQGVGGSDGLNNNATFGFLNMGAALGYVLEDFELSLGIHYAYGMSVSSLPGSLNTSFGEVSSLSSIWMGPGVAYRFHTSDIVDFSLRATYQFSFLQSPFAYQVFGFQLLVDMKG